jgi:LPXTG-motif cell wall-anchored protein
MRRALGTATVALGIAALAFSASPAVAATLPAGDAVYILPCDDDALDGLLYSVDTTTGVASRVGSWVNPDESVFSCAGPGAYNPVNGLGYWISWSGGVGYLISVDLTTGVNTLVAPFTIEGVNYYTPIALAIDDEGNAWAPSWGLPTDTLFSVDLATAALTEVGPTGVTPTSANFGLAWDPVTDTVYAYNVDGNDVYTVDTATGAFTVFDDDVLQTVEPDAIAFDSAGQLWGINQEIISAPLADLADFEVLAVINPYPPELEDDGNIYSESIIIAPKPAPVLPATGADSANAAVVAGIGGLLVLAGIVIARRRATARL